MFEVLKANVFRKHSEFQTDLSRCFDVYRLHHMIQRHINELRSLGDQAVELVQELEGARDE